MFADCLFLNVADARLRRLQGHDTGGPPQALLATASLETRTRWRRQTTCTGLICLPLTAHLPCLFLPTPVNSSLCDCGSKVVQPLPGVGAHLQAEMLQPLKALPAKKNVAPVPQAQPRSQSSASNGANNPSEELQGIQEERIKVCVRKRPLFKKVKRNYRCTPGKVITLSHQ